MTTRKRPTITEIVRSSRTPCRHYKNYKAMYAPKKACCLPCWNKYWTSLNDQRVEELEKELTCQDG